MVLDRWLNSEQKLPNKSTCHWFTWEKPDCWFTYSHSACMSVHGYYWRSVMRPSGTLHPCVCRVKCSECGTTHALLLSSIVPFSRYLFPSSKGSALTMKKDAASAWSVRPIHQLMKTTSNPYSGTTGSAGEKNCVLPGLASLHWVPWSFPVFRIIHRSSCRYTGGSTNFFPIPHSLTWQCLYCFLQ